MKKAVLVVGSGPYGLCLSKYFAENDFSIIVATIEEESIEKINSLGYHSIHTKDLYEDSCKTIYEESMKILEENNLELVYIVHTSRLGFYEINKDDEPSQEWKDKMIEINSMSPLYFARLFQDTNCHFIYTSSGATKAFNRDLSIRVKEPKTGDKKIGTRGLKYYSYVKRLGEENLYNFYKERNQLDLLTIIHISIMMKTHFFKDLNITDPKTKNLDADETARRIVKEVLKGNQRIYPDYKAMALKLFPSYINKYVLEYAMEKLYLLEDEII